MTTSSSNKYQTLRLVFAVIIGWFAGAIINMLLVQLGHTINPIEGVDPSDLDAYAEILPTLDFKYFVFPFLAHALGTLCGAFIAGLIATKRKILFALIVGVLFLIGGIAVNLMLPGPKWFAAVDILIAYLPMAWIGGKLGVLFSKKQSD